MNFLLLDEQIRKSRIRKEEFMGFLMSDVAEIKDEKSSIFLDIVLKIK